MNGYEYVYIHLPFCDVICHYCDFYTARAKDARHEELFSALTKEFFQQEKNLAPKLKAIYFGGGTPGVSPPPLLRKFLDLFQSRITPQTEVTLEVNPNNISEETVSAWREMGISRVSMGVQSLRADLLKRLGRVHTGDDALNGLKLCVAKIPNITADLIYAVPGQDLRTPAEDAEKLLDLGLKHISAYNLTLEKEHFLFPKILPGDDAFQQIEALSKKAASYGLRHYEISNMGLPGFESVNNCNYWKGGAYMALGPSAHGFDGVNKRWQNIADWEKYVRLLVDGKSPIDSEEILSKEQLMIERIFTSLRMEKGIPLEEFQKRFGMDLLVKNAAFIAELEKQGLGEVRDGFLKLSFRGRMLGDEIARKLL